MEQVCAVQLIGMFERIFAEAQLDLFLQPYVIVSTGSNSGLVQCLTDAIRYVVACNGIMKHVVSTVRAFFFFFQVNQKKLVKF